MRYGVFICSHGRPKAQDTLRVLRECGYNRDVYIVLDNYDTTFGEYQDLIDDNTHLKLFDKNLAYMTEDSGVDKQHSMFNTHLYAWNACEEFGKKYFDCYIICDDDLTGFRYRHEEDGHLKSIPITKNIDKLFTSYFQYMDNTNISCLSVADARNYIGGQAKDGRNMNTLIFRRADRPIEWKSEMYEEMVTSLVAQQTGSFIFQPTFFQYETKTMAKNAKGGMEEIYKSKSIFNRSAYVVMWHPSCVSFDANNTGFKLKKDNAFPKLISGKHKKLLKPV